MRLVSLSEGGNHDVRGDPRVLAEFAAIPANLALEPWDLGLPATPATRFWPGSPSTFRLHLMIGRQWVLLRRWADRERIAPVVGVGVADRMGYFDGAILRSGDASRTIPDRLP
jgi:hypothetical protein